MKHPEHKDSTPEAPQWVELYLCRTDTPRKLLRSSVHFQEVYFEDPLGLDQSWHMYFLAQINNGNFDDIIQGDE